MGIPMYTCPRCLERWRPSKAPPRSCPCCGTGIRHYLTIRGGLMRMRARFDRRKAL